MYDRESAAWERRRDEPERRERVERTADELANVVAPPGPVADLGCGPARKRSDSPGAVAGPPEAPCCGGRGDSASARLWGGRPWRWPRCYGCATTKSRRLSIDQQLYCADMSLGEAGGLLCLLAVVVAVIAAGVFIGVRLAQRRR